MKRPIFSNPSFFPFKGQGRVDREVDEPIARNRAESGGGACDERGGHQLHANLVVALVVGTDCGTAAGPHRLSDVASAALLGQVDGQRAVVRFGPLRVPGVRRSGRPDVAQGSSDGRRDHGVRRLQQDGRGQPPEREQRKQRLLQLRVGTAARHRHGLRNAKPVSQQRSLGTQSAPYSRHRPRAEVVHVSF